MMRFRRTPLALNRNQWAGIDPSPCGEPTYNPALSTTIPYPYRHLMGYPSHSLTLPETGIPRRTRTETPSLVRFLDVKFKSIFTRGSRSADDASTPWFWVEVDAEKA